MNNGKRVGECHGVPLPWQHGGAREVDDGGLPH